MAAIARRRDGETAYYFVSPAPERGSTVRMERRRTPRYPFAATAEITDEKANARSSSRVSDLSLHGCYVELADPFPQGTPVLIEIAAGTEYLEAHATVAYREPNLGMGVTFDAIQPYFATVLNQWLERAQETEH
ncbi:MAG TPA: PilZ domain-containing protein [Candidatus Acidoferrum sp.]|nr:PilZ domain-containing protein [Candidatus Acidoferrum sp.]